MGSSLQPHFLAGATNGAFLDFPRHTLAFLLVRQLDLDIADEEAAFVAEAASTLQAHETRLVPLASQRLDRDCVQNGRFACPTTRRGAARVAPHAVCVSITAFDERRI